MLLHTASHLTSEGVGLRHLCDWVVFASALSDAEFREFFEKKLKNFGLWRFAQVLTLLGIRYLGAPNRVWTLEAVESHKLDDATLDGLMNDILSGGNFGTKDMNRYREIKYISDRSEGTVGKNGLLRQGFKTMNTKVRRDYKTLGKHKALLPICYLAEGGKYIGLLITGKRKSSNTKQMLKTMLHKESITPDNLLNKDDTAYDTYMRGNHPLVKIKNHKITNGKKVLLVLDSYDCVVAPFLSLEFKQLDSIDIRSYTDSVTDYITENKPDVVIYMIDTYQS